MKYSNLDFFANNYDEKVSDANVYYRELIQKISNENELYKQKENMKLNEIVNKYSSQVIFLENLKEDYKQKFIDKENDIERFLIENQNLKEKLNKLDTELNFYKHKSKDLNQLIEAINIKNDFSNWENINMYKSKTWEDEIISKENLNCINDLERRILMMKKKHQSEIHELKLIIQQKNKRIEELFSDNTFNVSLKNQNELLEQELWNLRNKYENNMQEK